MIFSKIICRFYFFNIELVKNYNCSFPYNTLWIAIVFLYIGLFSFFFYDFFYMIFFKIVFAVFIFLILSSLRI
jgi:hypothetical protein